MTETYILERNHIRTQLQYLIFSKKSKHIFPLYWRAEVLKISDTHLSYGAQ
jgi:hypothetical protein